MKLKRLMDSYCANVGKKVEAIIFLFNGYRIAPDSTPNDLGMEDEDEIVALNQAPLRLQGHAYKRNTGNRSTMATQQKERMRQQLAKNDKSRQMANLNETTERCKPIFRAIIQLIQQPELICAHHMFKSPHQYVSQLLHELKPPCQFESGSAEKDAERAQRNFLTGMSTNSTKHSFKPCSQCASLMITQMFHTPEFCVMINTRSPGTVHAALTKWIGLPSLYSHLGRYLYSKTRLFRFNFTSSPLSIKN